MKRKRCCSHCQYFTLKNHKCNRHDLNLQTNQNAKRFYCKDFLFLYDKIPSIILE